MNTSLVGLLLVCVLLVLVNGQGDCPASCVRPSCVCASRDSPLPVAQTPQFVTLTWDDAVQTIMENAIQPVLNSSVNQNGCPIPSTYFVSSQYTEWQHVLKAFHSGSEIAAHTMNHVNLANESDIAAAEIQGSFDFIYQEGIPSDLAKGFRHPFLALSKASYDAVFDSGARYESSITVDPLVNGYWPFTLDNGMPFSPQPCESGCAELQASRYPGKWLIPMYQILDENNVLYSTMDPVLSLEADYDVALKNLQYSFNLHRRNKLPFGYYQHASTYVSSTPENNALRTKLLKDFIEWTLTEFDDVWYVTNNQLLDWMQDPVPLSDMQSRLPCLMPPTAGGPEICDGIDNDGNGITDDGLRASCFFEGGGTWQSCYGCPAFGFPSPDDATPARTGAGAGRALPPPAGCGVEVWDPVAGACVAVQRPATLTRVEAGLPGTAGSSPGKSSASGSGGTLRAVVLPLIGLLAFLSC